MKPANPKILCIEDDVETAELITEELAEHGYTVITANDGESGLAMLLREAPDLVLCDVGMPGMTGSSCWSNCARSRHVMLKFRSSF